LNTSQLKTYNPQLINAFLPAGVFNLKIPLVNYEQYIQQQQKKEEIISGNILLAEKQINLN
jgi:hypothetical protein